MVLVFIIYHCCAKQALLNTCVTHYNSGPKLSFLLHLLICRFIAIKFHKDSFCNTSFIMKLYCYSCKLICKTYSAIVLYGIFTSTNNFAETIMFLEPEATRDMMIDVLRYTCFNYQLSYNCSSNVITSL